MAIRPAFLYVPFSFVTGIFGMNMKEINGSPLPMWVPVAAFLVGEEFWLLLVILKARGRWEWSLAMCRLVFRQVDNKTTWA